MSGQSQGENGLNAYVIQSIGSAQIDPGRARGEVDIASNLATAGAGAILGRVISRAAGPLGGLIDLGVEKARDAHKSAVEEKDYIAGIKYMAEKGIPGFLYQEIKVNGNDATVAIDATRLVDSPNSKPWVWVNGAALDSPEITARVNMISSKVAEFAQQTESDIPKNTAAYAQELKEYAAKITAAKSPDEVREAGLPPLPAVLPAAVLLKSINGEYDKVLQKLYEPAPTPEPEPETAPAPPPSAPAMALKN